MRLNIQLFASGTITGTSTSSVGQIRINWSETISDDNVGYNVKATVQVRRTTGSSWGTFNGTITIDDASINVSKYRPESDPWNTTWKDVGTYNKYVSNSQGGSKTINIASTLTQSGTGMAGTYTASDDVELDLIHKAPSDIEYTITELNQLLIDAGISDDLFIENLSNKQFDITGTLYDDATISRIGMYNGATAYSDTSSPVYIDLASVTLRKDEETNKIPLAAYIKDSLGGQGVSGVLIGGDEYDYIAYTNPYILETSSRARRDGQISGKVKINIQGNFFNGIIGNINQSGTYKPTIQYKYWKLGDAEPTAYITIPSENVSITNNTFDVTEYEIGTIDETQPNYFDYRYAYRFRFKVIDNFKSVESSEKSIQVGIATWTEYKNRVDFKNITVQGDYVYPQTFSTTERIVGKWVNSKPIYRKVIDFGTLPNASQKVLAHNISDVEEFIRISGNATRSNDKDTLPIPYVTFNNNNQGGVIIYANETNIYITTNTNRSTYDAKIILEYTKTTD